jgi:monoterpene epsilon-lactone hydrolase
MSATRRILQTAFSVVAAGIIVAAVMVSFAQDKHDFSQAPVSPEVKVDPDGTLHWGARTIPFPRYASKESRDAYMALINSALNAGQPTDPKLYPAWAAKRLENLFGREKAMALKLYPVDEQDGKVGGVDAATYTPKTMPAKNRDKVMLEFEVDSTAIAVASLAQVKVIALHYGLNPSTEPHRELLAAYSELLKTYKPKDIAMFGTSGGCSLLQTTLTWLPAQKLPFPAAAGLLTCGGAADGGDTWTLNDGVDAIQSVYLFPARPPRRPMDLSVPRKPGEPPRTPLEGDIPKGYPPTYLLAGTRDMSLSEIVMLHRKLRNAGVEADLNVFEGMWHGFDDDTEAPESHEALADLAHFLSMHIGK